MDYTLTDSRTSSGGRRPSSPQRASASRGLEGAAAVLSSVAGRMADRTGHCTGRSASSLCAGGGGSLPLREVDRETEAIAAPPASNTGAQTAQVDWLAVTFPDGVAPETVAKRLGWESWSEMPRGWSGYRAGWVNGNVRLLFDGAEGMGVHVEASGQGCRQLEAGGVVGDWQGFLGQLVSDGASFSRLDVALDDRAGLLDVGRATEAVRAGQVVSRYRKVLLEQTLNATSGEDAGTTIYFGSPVSDTRIRMYDKRLEQICKGENLFALPDHWVRVELQARDEKADSLAAALIEHGVQVVARVLAGLLDFKAVGVSKQRERWATVDWWASFLEAASKVRLVVAKTVRSLGRLVSWFRSQVAPAMGVLFAAEGGKLQVFEELAQEGVDRFKPGSWHVKLLDQIAQLGHADRLCAQV